MAPASCLARRHSHAGAGPADDEGLLAKAERFLALFHAESEGADPPADRLERVRREIESTGTYRHTTAELTFAARVAWRNSARCIGRLYWRSLRVRDRRQVTAADQIAAESVAHLRAATNRGRIRPLITVFAPDAPGRPGPRILSSQLVRYAGYASSAGLAAGYAGPAATAGRAGAWPPPAADRPAVLGDPANVALTSLARQLGWRGPAEPGRFDVLPLVIAAGNGALSWHELPRDAVLEVPLEHPEHAWFAGLGLRWYAVPVISDMHLEAGGIRYPAAPFNGWYMCTEIGSRDLGDAGRYDELPVVAAAMGLDTGNERTLWKDRALTELNQAVLHSYAVAGVTIADHHTESVRFLKHVELEEAHGRSCPADWSWIVPPAASSATPVFHRYYDNFDATPSFSRPAEPIEDWAEAASGF